MAILLNWRAGSEFAIISLCYLSILLAGGMLMVSTVF